MIHEKISVVLIIMGILLLVGSTKFSGFSVQTISSVKEESFVMRVIDGDTVVLANNETVRMSGINTPETGECYYQEAKDRLNELVINKTVLLESDRTDRGKYGRLLRYIYVDNVSVNFLLVEEGYARVYDKYKEDTKYYTQMKLLEAPVKEAEIGVWGCVDRTEMCAYAASKNSELYHTSGCKYAKKIKSDNLLCFSSSEEAESAGHKFSGC